MLVEPRTAKHTASPRGPTAASTSAERCLTLPLAFTLVLATLSACKGGKEEDGALERASAQAKTTATETDESLSGLYTVVSDEVLGPYKRTVTVEVPEPLTKAQLGAIAKRIKDSKSAQAERTYINFNIKNTPPPDQFANWATVRFDPDMRIDIYGDE